MQALTSVLALRTAREDVKRQHGRCLASRARVPKPEPRRAKTDLVEQVHRHVLVNGQVSSLLDSTCSVGGRGRLWWRATKCGIIRVSGGLRVYTTQSLPWH